MSKSILDSLSAIEIAGYKAHSRSTKYQQRLDEAQNIIIKGLALAPDAYIACSFGKDSAVLLDMCLSINADIQARFLRWSESNDLNNFDEIIADWKQRIQFNLVIVDLHRDSLDDKRHNRWDELANVQDASGYFIGLRAEESRARKITLNVHGQIYRKVDSMLRVAPLAFWSEKDVATYIVTKDLPTLNAYHVDGFSVRTSSRVPRESVRRDALIQLKNRDIHAFMRLEKRFPEISNWI